jgi:hypothetical protein
VSALRRDRLGAGAMIEFLTGMALFLAVLALMGLLAEWWDGRERRAARKRNRARPWR